ncbi:hypothetical protein CC78DRAFT_122337 [Lojkania enalia]|uniref:Uncharacterized protein n=1 Tax=Lojkania enalia TaxID=147567 RepID=A0A9P4KEZ5_9PLEO|nr:hypothetical protein CC78DRAFT_122337 [Didymosphaeria enalia]
MKTSNVLASLLFGSLAIAAPFDKRALVTKTEVVVETVVVYTTVWEGEAPSTAAAETTSAAGLFFEKPASSSATPTSTPAPYAPPVVEQPSSTSVYTPPPPPPPPPSSSSVYTPPPPPPSSSVYTPPVAAPSSVYVPPPPPASSAVPTQSSSPSTGNTGGGGGGEYSGDITIYDNTGAAGACGESLTDDMAICALAKPTWGESTYDVMTGEATNKWCGQKIKLFYNGRTAECTIMDMCPGCSGADIDMSYSVWQTLTGLTEKTRLQGTWAPI